MRVTVPDSGNYTLAVRPTTIDNSADVGVVYSGLGRRRSRRNRRRLGTDPAESSGADAGFVYAWSVDLTHPETIVTLRPAPVTTAGEAVFAFACAVAGEEPSRGCRYEYQMAGGVRSAVDWDSLEWLPTVSSWDRCVSL